MFWNLTEPHDEKRLADWLDEKKARFEGINCPLEPRDHFRPGRRTSPLSVELPDTKPLDFVWTWGSECLVQEKVVELLNGSGFTGYHLIPVPNVEFKKKLRKPPKLWEINITGSAGMASPESGTRVLRACPGCGLADYSRITNPTKLIDPSRWDGSDFFRVEPVIGFIFVTGRVVQALQENKISGWRARSLSELQASFDNVLLVDTKGVN